MAFQTNSDFHVFLTNGAVLTTNESKSVAENFVMEERLSTDREKSYVSSGLNSFNTFGDWNAKHNDYYYEKLKYLETPETFTDINNGNYCKGLKGESFFLRIDTISEKVCKGLGVNDVFMFNVLKSYFIDSKSEWRYLVEKYYDLWNKTGRDNRPVFVTLYDSVESILTNNSLTIDKQLSKLRDLLGLTHYVSGRMLVLHKYAVKDVLKDAKNPDSLVAIPTVLDTDLNPVFFPSPKSSANGLTVQCCSYTGNQMPEVVHKKIDLNTSHFYNLGIVSDEVSMAWSDARANHKELICSQFCNEL